jgi:hypothetical protein
MISRANDAAIAPQAPGSPLANQRGMDALEYEMELGDEYIIETHVSDVMGDLARLADGSGTPRLRGAIEWNELDQSEAWAVSLVAAGFTVQAIQEMSPLDEDSTTELLAKLITSRTIMMS